MILSIVRNFIRRDHRQQPRPPDGLSAKVSVPIYLARADGRPTVQKVSSPSSR